MRKFNLHKINIIILFINSFVFDPVYFYFDFVVGVDTDPIAIDVLFVDDEVCMIFLIFEFELLFFCGI